AAEECPAVARSGERAGGSAAQSHYEAACALSTGVFLPDALYADWSIAARAQLSQTYQLMCAALATHPLAATRYDDAARWAAAIVAENPSDEPAYQLLMHAHAAAGRRHEAVRQFRRCERVLAE